MLLCEVAEGNRRVQRELLELVAELELELDLMEKMPAAAARRRRRMCVRRVASDMAQSGTVARLIRSLVRALRGQMKVEILEIRFTMD